MADPFRLSVLKAVTECLKGITVANGYQHDMGDFLDEAGRTQGRVFRGRTIYGANDPLPMMSILEDPRAIEPNNGPGASAKTVNSFRLLIQGFVSDDREHPLDPAYRLSADTIKALVGEKLDRYNMLGLGKKSPCVIDIQVGQPVHRPADDDISSVAFFVVGLTLTLAENLEKPFKEEP